MFRRLSARLRKLVASATNRTSPKPSRRPPKPLLELLEDRLAPAVVNYNAATDTLTFTGLAGGDNVTVTTPTSTTLRIVVDPRPSSSQYRRRREPCHSSSRALGASR